MSGCVTSAFWLLAAAVFVVGVVALLLSGDLSPSFSL